MPAELLVSTCTLPVSRLVKVTFAPGMIAPVESVIKPWMEARYCACSGRHTVSAQIASRKINVESFNVFIQTSDWSVGYVGCAGSQTRLGLLRQVQVRAKRSTRQNRFS